VDRVHLGRRGDQVVGRLHAHHSVEQGQGQREQEGQGHLLHRRAGEHPLLRAQAAQDGVPCGVVGGLAQLLEGQNRGGGQQEGEAQIQPQKQGQELVSHDLLIEGQAALHPQVGGGLLILRQGGLDLFLSLLRVPGVVGGPHLTPEGQLLRHLVRDDHAGQPQVSGGQGRASLRQKAGQGAGVGRRALPRQQTIAVGQADGRGGVFYPSDRGIVVIDRGVLPPGQGVRLHAVGGQQGIKVHATQVVGVLVLDGDVKGGLPVGGGLDGAVEADGAGGDAHSQEQEDADHGLGQVSRVDPADPLAQGKEMQVPVVEAGVAPGQPQHKAGQGAKDQQGAHCPQSQHRDAQEGEHHGEGHPEGEQNGVGRRQAHPAQDQLEHRGPEGAGAKLLIFPSSLHQIQQLGSGDLDAAEAHDQQENQAEVEHSAPRRPGGEGQPEGVHPKGEHGQGEGGQALRGRQSQQQAQGQGGRADQPRLQHQQKGYLPLAQAKKQIGAQLPLPPAHEEPVGVQDQTGQNHRHKDGKDVDAGLDDLGHGILALGQVDHRPLSIQRAEGIEQAHAEGEGKQIHAVVPKGAADVAQGQLTEHLPSLLPAG